MIKRVTELETQLKLKNARYFLSGRMSDRIHADHRPYRSFNPRSSTPPPKQPSFKKPRPAPRPFDPSRYTTRLIALKFAYLGQRYNGFEHHANNKTPLPTIEEEIFKALTKTRLIFPTRMNELKDGEIDWEGCEYSKCGRTDRGVSAFGQVIAVRVRSNRPLPKPQENEDTSMEAQEEAGDGEKQPEKPFDTVRDELPYIQLLNRVLPDDIRILAWCADPPANFSARFNCRERRYRYFFTQPAFAPVPGARGLQTTRDGKLLREGYLDIEAMQDAAKRLEGLHDFRNFCKVDPAKQITNFERRIFHAGITRVDPATEPVGYVAQPQFGQRGNAASGVANGASHGKEDEDDAMPPVTYTFDVNGSAFLWHQVRHMVAVIFLVGQGLEPASIVSDLLDVAKTPTRPKYEMATDQPLVLWDCIFPNTEAYDAPDEERQDALHWIFVGDEGGRETNKNPALDGGDGKFGRMGIMDTLWEVWHRRKIEEVLAGSLLDVVAAQGRQNSLPAAPGAEMSRSVRVYDGGHVPRTVGRYTEVMRKERMESVEVVNRRYRERKGLPEPAAGMDVDADE